MTPWLDDGDVVLYHGDALTVLGELEASSAQTCVTSPPYWGLRDYGSDGQLGLEPSPDSYVASMVTVFRAIARVLRDDGTLWLNLGDSYSHGGNGSRDAGRWPKQSRNDHRLEHRNRSGLGPKQLVGIPWRVAFALQADGWYLRSDVIWSKPNPMPESVTDRPTKAHEYLFLMSKSQRYVYDAGAIRERADYFGPNGANGARPGHPRAGEMKSRSGNKQRKPNPAAVLGRGDTAHGIPWEGFDRNARTVWEIPTQPQPDAHFATFPEALVRPCILAGCPAGGVVLDPFMGSGTTALVARKHGRRSVGVELNQEYLEIAARRLGQQSLLSPAIAPAVGSEREVS